MALGPSSGGPVGNKAINFSFWAPFLSYFLFAEKESTGNIANEVSKIKIK